MGGVPMNKKLLDWIKKKGFIYEEGKEDDQSGAQSKFDFDTRTIKHGVK